MPDKLKLQTIQAADRPWVTPLGNAWPQDSDHLPYNPASSQNSLRTFVRPGLRVLGGGGVGGIRKHKIWPPLSRAFIKG